MNAKTIASALVIVATTGYPSNWANAAEDSLVTTNRTSIVNPQLHDESSYLDRIAPKYLSFAGSEENLASIASGLRTGGMITLQAPTGTSVETLSFLPPTKPMGYGNITHALDLAARELASAGITSPTPEQLQAALTGGTVVSPMGQTSLLPGVLQLRSQGMGWGQIAHTLGVPLAPKAPLSSSSSVATVHAKGTGITTAAGISKLHPAGSDRNGKPEVATSAGHGSISHGGGSMQTHAGIVSAAGGNASFGTSISATQNGNTTPHTHITTGSSSYGHGRTLEKLKF